MAIESFYAEIGGNADGLIRAAGEGEAAAGSLERRLNTVGGGMQSIGKAANEHIGGTAVHNVGLLDRAFNGVFGSIKSVVGSMVSMVGQTAGIGALFAGGAGLAEGVKLAEQYNEQMALITAAYHEQGKAVPTAQITALLDKETALGFAESSSLPALRELAQAHLSVSQQMAVEATASDLARAKNIDLATATDLILKATQGTGRGLQDLGINLPAPIPKMAALTAATAAAAKAQAAYHLELDKYGAQNPKTIAALDKYDTAAAKVGADQKAMNDHFSALPQTLDAINSRLSGSAAAYSKANPLASMGSDLQSIARVAGEALLPELDKFAGWVKTNEPGIKDFAINAVHALGTAASDAGGFIANDLYPPVKDVFGFVSDHKQAFIDGVGALTALYAGKKAANLAGTVFGDVKGLVSGLTSIPGLISKIGGGLGGGVSKLAPVDVYVVNMGAGGGGNLLGDAGKVGLGAGAAEGAGLSLTAIAGIVAAPVVVGAAAGAFMVWANRNSKFIPGGNVSHGKPAGSSSGQIFDDLLGAANLNPRMVGLIGQDVNDAQNHLAAFNKSSQSTATMADQLEAAIKKGSVKTPGQVDEWIVQWNAANGYMSTVAQEVAGIVSDMRSAGGGAINMAGKMQSIARKGYAAGGEITEPIMGIGVNTGTAYSFGESGREWVIPDSGMGPGASAGAFSSGGAGSVYIGSVTIPISGANNPEAVAVAVRNELLNLVGRGAFDRTFGGR